MSSPDLSVVIVSFNAREALRDCLVGLAREAADLACETFVIDNASRDGSADLVETEFPQVHLLRSDTNLGFAAANNRVFPLARGRHIALLNPDAVPQAGSLERAVARMDAEPEVGLAGARLVAPDGSWQPSARSFPSALNDLLVLSGLSSRFPRSRFFGRADRTWADPAEAADVDWVPGAFSIIRRDVLQRVGDFDERFFLYYEEVDFCRRIKAAGYVIRYWPDVVVTHRGGECAKSHAEMDFSASGSQLTAWRMRSALLYHRKHGGRPAAWAAAGAETMWYALRAYRNARSGNADRRRKAAESRRRIALMRQAWSDTAGGLISPARPW